MEKEIWKDIPDYNGYQVSNLGRVRTYNKITYTKKRGERHWKDRILKFKEKVPKKHSKHQGVQGKGYAVDLWKNGKNKTFLVSRLVAFTFYGKDINDRNLTVDHIDGNRLNNNIENLDIVTLKENIIRSYKTGLHNSHTKQIILINKKTKEQKIIYSMSEASRTINKNDGYISCKINKNIFENDEYIWRLF